MRRLIVVMSLAASLPSADLAVKEVVLYKHGVGFFSRAGELSPGESARLQFKADEMNDVLKSLTVSVTGGAGVAGLRYDSSEPLKVKLDKFPLTIGKQQALSALLDQFKGARIEITVGPQTVAGAIISARLIAAAADTPEREQITLLIDGGAIRTLDLSAATSVKLADPKLQLQLTDYLATLTQARSQDLRNVYIDSTDSARRTVRASYTIPTPVWKSSYRLILPSTGESTLEGWAIVDNTTSDDWSGVNLSLVSGRPVSFISPLYEPKYRDRPTVDLPDEGPSAPVVHAGAVMSAPPPPPAAMAAPGGARQRLAASRKIDAPASEMMFDSVIATEATASGRELGDLFEYRFGQPVTVKKNESAMLPFLQQKLTARKLLIYTDQSLAHPLNAAELTNSTGQTLDGGPITVYDAGAYAGEALVETVKSGDKRLISYATDIGTRITTNIDSARENVRELHLRRGILTARAAIQETRTYTIRNVDAKAKTLIIEHPLRDGYKLLDAKPTETTASAYRFQVALAAAAETKFVVKEERLYDQTWSITNLNNDMLVSFASNKVLSPDARKQLEAIIAKKAELAQVDRDLAGADKEREEVTADQQRVRENIAALNRVAGQQDQVQTYTRQLAASETQIAALRDRAAQLRKRKAALESEISNLISQANF